MRNVNIPWNILFAYYGSQCYPSDKSKHRFAWCELQSEFERSSSFNKQIRSFSRVGRGYCFRELFNLFNSWAFCVTPPPPVPPSQPLPCCLVAAAGWALHPQFPVVVAWWGPQCILQNVNFRVADTDFSHPEDYICKDASFESTERFSKAK